MTLRFEFQQLIVGLIVLGAALFIVRRIWSAISSARASKHAGCDSGCGCAPAATPARGNIARD